MVTRERLLETLNGPWAHYVAAYDALSSDVQKEYLRRQGYRRFADVLAHIRAWWLRGRAIVESLVADPAMAATEIDVDSFNAAAVADVQAQTDVEVRSAFEQARRDMIDLLIGYRRRHSVRSASSANSTWRSSGTRPNTRWPSTEPLPMMRKGCLVARSTQEPVSPRHQQP